MADFLWRVFAILLGALVLVAIPAVIAMLTIYGIASVTLRRVSGHTH